MQRPQKITFGEMRGSGRERAFDLLRGLSKAAHVNCRLDHQVLATTAFSGGPVWGANVPVSASAGLQQAEHSMRLVTPARGLVWGPPYPRMFHKAYLASFRIP